MLLECELILNLKSNLNGGHLEQEIIPLSGDSDLEKVSGNSLEEEISSSGSLDAPLSNVGERMNHTKVPIPPPILTGEKITSN